MDIGTIRNLPKSYFRRVEFTTQLGCSVGCTFCPQKTFMEATRGEERVLTRETVSRILGNLKGSPVREVHFSGFSEPFLNPESGDFILMSHEAGFQVVIFSTLKGLTRETLEKIKDVPVKLLHVSIHPPGSGTHPGLDDDYAWSQIDMLLSVRHRFQLRFGCVDAGCSMQEKAELERRCQVRGIKVICGKVLDRAGNLPEGKSKRHPDTSHLLCTRNIGSVILPDGECCWCSMDYGTRHRVGNLRDATYNQLLCSPAVQHMLRSMAGSGEVENLLCHQCESAHPLTRRERGWDLLKRQFFNTRVDCSGGGK